MLSTARACGLAAVKRSTASFLRSNLQLNGSLPAFSQLLQQVVHTWYRSDVRLARLAPLLMMAVAGCGPGSNAPPDGGPPLALDVVDNPQIGLHYGKTTQRPVRYHTVDAPAAPVAGAT